MNNQMGNSTPMITDYITVLLLLAIAILLAYNVLHGDQKMNNGSNGMQGGQGGQDGGQGGRGGRQGGRGQPARHYLTQVVMGTGIDTCVDLRHTIVNCLSHDTPIKPAWVSVSMGPLQTCTCKHGISYLWPQQSAIEMEVPQH
ncbi:hypothetical protein BDZ97DRAFT_1758558 [Flammula alnicola]|nr:hypothetical protein BDZ97DRAFT_1758558 [Flammula alnicola]